MEPLNLLENGNIPQKRKFSYCQVAFCLLMLVLIIISALSSIVFYLLHQASGPCWAHGLLKMTHTNAKDPLRWELNVENCNGLVQKDGDQYLIIEQSGNYFVYGQVYRKHVMNESFTLMLCKEQNIVLNKAVGPKEGDDRGTVNFGRPFFLQKGDKLYCQGNYEPAKTLLESQTYWGLYRM